MTETLRSGSAQECMNMIVTMRAIHFQQQHSEETILYECYKTGY